jgi:hypothetical protein
MTSAPVDRELMEQDLADHLVGREGSGLLPRSDQAQLKTYLVEAHPAWTVDAARDRLREAVDGLGGQFVATDDPTLVLAHLRVDSEGVVQDVGYWVDFAHPRYWLLHSKNRAAPAQNALKALLAGSGHLDQGWLPRNQLRRIQQTFRPFGFRLSFDERVFWRGDDVAELEEPTHRLAVEHAGVGSEGMYELLRSHHLTRRAMAVSEVAFWDRSHGSTQLMRLTRGGRLRSSGPNIDSHLLAARTLLRSYAAFIGALEQHFALRFSESDVEGVVITGRPLALQAAKPASFDFRRLVERLVSGVEPFRMLGNVEWVEEDLAWIEAVDLHTGAPLRADLTPDWLRLYLSQGTCGNTLARFITNLQRTYNADLSAFGEAEQAILALD